jgi:hypothetical protein
MVNRDTTPVTDQVLAIAKARGLKTRGDILTTEVIREAMVQTRRPEEDPGGRIASRRWIRQ